MPTPDNTTTNQSSSTDHVKAAADMVATTTTTDSKTIAPLGDFFLQAVEDNKVYYAAKKSAGKFGSPLFKLAQRLKSHPELKELAAKDAFISVNALVQPDWEKLFPDVSLPSLEFITAWEQINIPHGVSPLQIIQKHLAMPLKLLSEPTCEGYHHYLGIAFHLQRLTPRRNILLPVERVSEILTVVLGKPVSPQSVSYYCAQAKKDGYITLVAKAHHPSKKAAHYRFDLSRISDTGEELKHKENAADSAADDFNHFNHGNHGSQGIQGNDGSNGNKESSSSCVLKHAKKPQGKIKNKNQQEEETNKIEDKEEKTDDKYWNKDEQLNTEVEVEIEDITSAQETCSQPPQNVMSKGQKKIKRQSVVTLWQSIMNSRFGWQEKLSKAEYTMLIKFGQRTDECGYLILQWALDHWDLFAQQAVGKAVEYPATPNVTFFFAYQAVAFNLWFRAKPESEEAAAAFYEAIDKSTKDIDELEMFYALGEEVQYQTVEAVLAYKGLLTKHPQGWEVCGNVFKYKAAIDHKYCNDEHFRNLLREAAAIPSLCEH